MITILSLILIGAVLGIGGLFAYGLIDDALAHRRRLIQAAELQRQRSEARIEQITQNAVAQMMAAARQGAQRDG